jgi:hypothetical protein
VRLLNDSLDLCLDDSASVHVDLDAVAYLEFSPVVVGLFGCLLARSARASANWITNVSRGE